MNTKATRGVMLALLLASMLTLTFNIQQVTAEEWDIIVPDDYEKIQWAVGNATDGDRIYVRNGNYTENVIVSKSLTLHGQNPKNTIIKCPDESLHDDTVNITASGCTLEGFTIENGGRPLHGGIKLSSDDNIVRNNIICDNRDDGILVEGCYNTVTNNTFYNNVGSSIALSHSNNNITNNDIKNCTVYHLEGRTGPGIWVKSSNDNFIVNNNISNTIYGIIIQTQSSNNFIANNNISHNYDGIFVVSSGYDNTITNNTIADSIPDPNGANGYGLYIVSSNYNCIYHNNIIDNTHQVYNEYSYNCWHNCYPSGGNY